MSHELKLLFRPPVDHPPGLREHLMLVQRFTRALGRQDALLGETTWLLSGDTKEDSYQYPVFDTEGPTTAAVAVLNQELRGQDVMKFLALWNGQEKKSEGASIAYYFDRKDGAASACNVTLGAAPPSSRLGDWRQVAEAVREAVLIWKPLVATFGTRNYDSVFADRPGAGWMLYLPIALTAQQVPEARALVPVIGSGQKQTGTIIVSITDELFSDKNPEHVRIANAIEVRLVDQDLLPRYLDL